MQIKQNIIIINVILKYFSVAKYSLSTICYTLYISGYDIWYNMPNGEIAWYNHISLFIS